METYVIHEIISKIVKIHGISRSTDDKIEIQYAEEPTQEQKQKIEEFLNTLPLIIEKNLKYEQIDNDFAKTIDEGYTTSYGWKMGLGIQDITLLSSFFLLAKTANDNNIPIPDLIDKDGIPRQLDINQLTILMLQYGQYRADMSFTYATRRKNVNDATTIEEVKNA